MSVEEQESVVRQYIEAWNRQDLAAVGEMLTPDFIRHDANLPDVEGAQGELDFVGAVVHAFPDIRLHADRLITQDEFVAIRLSIRGTHRDTFMGVPATRRAIAVESMEMFRLSDAKIAELWVVIDLLGFFQQLGVVPDVP